MNQALRDAAGRQEVVSKDFSDLGSAIAALPSQYRSQLEPLLERVVENSSRRRRILSLVQDALGQLRLDMKYLMFDLEATRRERDEYRRQAGDEQ
ncbi:MAG TPA: transcriptional regulator [Pirellulales bacterium]|nr:transcriptional regulator [Pirellulales bacterium]